MHKSSSKKSEMYMPTMNYEMGGPNGEHPMDHPGTSTMRKSPKGKSIAVTKKQQQMQQQQAFNKSFNDSIERNFMKYNFAADPIAAAAANTTMVMPTPAIIPFPPMQPNEPAFPHPSDNIPYKKKATPRVRKNAAAPKPAKSPKAPPTARQPKRNGAVAKARYTRKPRQPKDQEGGSPTTNGTGRRRKTPVYPRSPRQSKKHTPQEDQIAHLLASSLTSPYSHGNSTVTSSDPPYYPNGIADHQHSNATQSPLDSAQYVNGMSAYERETVEILSNMRYSNLPLPSTPSATVTSGSAANPMTNYEQWQPQISETGFGSPIRFNNKTDPSEDEKPKTSKIVYQLIPEDEAVKSRNNNSFKFPEFPAETEVTPDSIMFAFLSDHNHYNNSADTITSQKQASAEPHARNRSGMQDSGKVKTEKAQPVSKKYQRINNTKNNNSNNSNKNLFKEDSTNYGKHNNSSSSRIVTVQQEQPQPQQQQLCESQARRPSLYRENSQTINGPVAAEPTMPAPVYNPGAKLYPEQDSGYISPDQKSPIDYSKNGAAMFVAPQAPPIKVATPVQSPSTPNDTNNNNKYSSTEQLQTNATSEAPLCAKSQSHVELGAKKRWLRQATSENENAATPLKKRRIAREVETYDVPPIVPTPLFNGVISAQLVNTVDQILNSLDPTYVDPNQQPPPPQVQTDSPQRPYLLQQKSILEEFVNVACARSLPQPAGFENTDNEAVSPVIENLPVIPKSLVNEWEPKEFERQESEEKIIKPEQESEPPVEFEEFNLAIGGSRSTKSKGKKERKTPTKASKKQERAQKSHKEPKKPAKTKGKKTRASKPTKKELKRLEEEKLRLENSGLDEAGPSEILTSRKSTKTPKSSKTPTKRKCEKRSEELDYGNKFLEQQRMMLELFAEQRKKELEQSNKQNKTEDVKEEEVKTETTDKSENPIKIEAKQPELNPSAIKVEESLEEMGLSPVKLEKSEDSDQEKFDFEPVKLEPQQEETKFVDLKRWDEEKFDLNSTESNLKQLDQEKLNSNPVTFSSNLEKSDAEQVKLISNAATFDSDLIKSNLAHFEQARMDLERSNLEKFDAMDSELEKMNAEDLDTKKCNSELIIPVLAKNFDQELPKSEEKRCIIAKDFETTKWNLKPEILNSEQEKSNVEAETSRSALAKLNLEQIESNLEKLSSEPVNLNLQLTNSILERTNLEKLNSGVEKVVLESEKLHSGPAETISERSNKQILYCEETNSNQPGKTENLAKSYSEEKTMNCNRSNSQKTDSELDLSNLQQIKMLRSRSESYASDSSNETDFKSIEKSVSNESNPERMENEKSNSKQMKMKLRKSSSSVPETLNKKLKKSIRLNSEQINAEKLSLEQAKLEKLNSERVKLEKLNFDRIQAEKLNAERARQEKLNLEQMQAEKSNLAGKSKPLKLSPEAKPEKLEKERMHTENSDSVKKLDLKRSKKLNLEQNLTEKLDSERIKTGKSDFDRTSPEKLSTERKSNSEPIENSKRTETPKPVQIQARKLNLRRPKKSERSQIENTDLERQSVEKLSSERILSDKLKTEKSNLERVQPNIDKALEVKPKKSQIKEKVNKNQNRIEKTSSKIVKIGKIVAQPKTDSQLKAEPKSELNLKSVLQAPLKSDSNLKSESHSKTEPLVKVETQMKFTPQALPKIAPTSLTLPKIVSQPQNDKETLFAADKIIVTETVSLPEDPKQVFEVPVRTRKLNASPKKLIKPIKNPLEVSTIEEKKLETAVEPKNENEVIEKLLGFTEKLEDINIDEKIELDMKCQVQEKLEVPESPEVLENHEIIQQQEPKSLAESPDEEKNSCVEREIKKFQDELEKFKNPELQPIQHHQKNLNGFDESPVTESELKKLLDTVDKFHSHSIQQLKTKNSKFHKKQEKRRLNLNIDYQFQDDHLKVQIMSPKAEDENSLLLVTTPRASEPKIINNYHLTPLDSPPPDKPTLPFRELLAKRSLSFDNRPRTISNSSSTSSKQDSNLEHSIRPLSPILSQKPAISAEIAEGFGTRFYQEQPKFNYSALLQHSSVIANNNSVYSKFLNNSQPLFPYFENNAPLVQSPIGQTVSTSLTSTPTAAVLKSPFNYAAIQQSLKFLSSQSQSAPTTPCVSINTNPNNAGTVSSNPEAVSANVTEDDRYLKPIYPKIFTKTASSDPRLNPTLNVEQKEKEAPVPKKKLSLDQYRKRKSQTSLSATTTPESTSPPKLDSSNEC